ncbi:hypothetical protein HWV62_7533 [Athelia sp. TMB]|nr:hypothetical protein HWV62_7533 [Athelia sp. TMB]
MSLPTSTKAIVLRKDASGAKEVFHEAVISTIPIPSLQSGQVLVKLSALAFNRRDLWLRMGQYPGLAFDKVMGSDGVGQVIAAADPQDELLNKRVFFLPMKGWEKDPDAPEADFAVVGGVKYAEYGTFAEYTVVDRNQLLLAPEYIDDLHLAAFPLGGLTAWRATMVNGRVSPGQTVLVTGAGGGVAIVAIQLCIAQGANVYVTSGNAEKIKKAVEIGAKGGVCYKDADWPTQLAELIKKDGIKHVDVVIDSAGGEQLMTQVGKVLKQGGIVVCYGMTAGRQINMTMREVLRNQRLVGSTMGSKADLKEATAFLEKHRIFPTVSHVLYGLEGALEGFEIMKQGESFGKIVVDLSGRKASL